MSDSNEGSRLAGYGVAGRQLTDRESWASFWVLFIFGFATVCLMFKVSPVLTDIEQAYGFTLQNVGWVSSIFAIAGLVVSFPGAWVMRKFGIKFTLMVTAVITILGSILGIMASSGAVFLVSRALEGFGMGMISVVGPNVMVRLFPLRKQGLIMGIWSLWVPVGSILAFVSTPLLYGSYGWQSLWYVSIIIEGIATALILAFFRVSKVPYNVLEMKTDKDIKSGPAKFHGKIYMASAVVVGLIFTIWSFCYAGCINIFYPTYLQAAAGMSVLASSMVPTVIAAITIPAGIAFGLIADKTNSRKWFLSIGYLVFAAAIGLFAYNAAPGSANPWIFAIIMGFVAGAVPMATRAFIPVLVRDPEKVDYVLAIMAFTTWLGQMFMGFYGSTVASLGFYQTGLVLMVPLLLVACVAVALTKSDCKILADPAGEEKSQSKTTNGACQDSADSESRA